MGPQSPQCPKSASSRICPDFLVLTSKMKLQTPPDPKQAFPGYRTSAWLNADAPRTNGPTTTGVPRKPHTPTSL